MAKRRAQASVIQFPLGRPESKSIDVRKLLLEKQSTPTVLVPADLRKAIDARAREMAEEAYLLCREHLERRVAYAAEWNTPREIDRDSALEVIAQGDLGAALTREYAAELRRLARFAEGTALAAVKHSEALQALLGAVEND